MNEYRLNYLEDLINNSSIRLELTFTDKTLPVLKVFDLSKCKYLVKKYRLVKSTRQAYYNLPKQAYSYMELLAYALGIPVLNKIIQRKRIDKEISEYKKIDAYVKTIIKRSKEEL